MVGSRFVQGAFKLGSVVEVVTTTLPGLLSDVRVAAVCVAALVCAATVTTTCTLPVAPGATVPTLQVTVPPLAPQPVEALTKVVPAGSGSLMITLLAATAPWFV